MTTSLDTSTQSADKKETLLGTTVLGRFWGRGYFSTRLSTSERAFVAGFGDFWPNRSETYNIRNTKEPVCSQARYVYLFGNVAGFLLNQVNDKMDSAEQNPLTPKEEAFCLKYVELKNASEAYRASYDVGEDTKTRKRS